MSSLLPVLAIFLESRQGIYLGVPIRFRFPPKLFFGGVANRFGISRRGESGESIAKAPCFAFHPKREKVPYPCDFGAFSVLAQVAPERKIGIVILTSQCLQGGKIFSGVCFRFVRWNGVLGYGFSKEPR